MYRRLPVPLLVICIACGVPVSSDSGVESVGGKADYQAPEGVRLLLVPSSSFPLDQIELSRDGEIVKALGEGGAGPLVILEDDEPDAAWGPWLLRLFREDGTLAVQEEMTWSWWDGYGLMGYYAPGGVQLVVVSRSTQPVTIHNPCPGKLAAAVTPLPGEDVRWIEPRGTIDVEAPMGAVIGLGTSEPDPTVKSSFAGRYRASAVESELEPDTSVCSFALQIEQVEVNMTDGGGETWDYFYGDPDPYVKVLLGDHRGESEPVTDAFELHRPEGARLRKVTGDELMAQTLRIEVYDSEVSGDDALIGRCSPLMRIPEEAPLPLELESACGGATVRLGVHWLQRVALPAE